MPAPFGFIPGVNLRIDFVIFLAMLYIFRYRLDTRGGVIVGIADYKDAVVLILPEELQRATYDYLFSLSMAPGSKDTAVKFETTTLVDMPVYLTMDGRILNFLALVVLKDKLTEVV